MTSSSASSPCRLEWRPSRALTFALALLGVLAATALWRSGLPRPVAALAGLLALAEGWRLALRYRNLPSFELQWPGHHEPARLNFSGTIRVLDAVTVDFRGPLARLSGRDPDGRIERWQWWPDTLPPAARRSLRLTASRSAGARVASPTSV